MNVEGTIRDAQDCPPGARRYRMRPEALPEAERRVRNQQVIPYVAIVSAAFLLTMFLVVRRSSELRIVFVLAMIAAVFLTYIFFVVPRRTRKVLARIWDTYSLEIGPDYLLRRQGDVPDLRMAFADVRRIERRGGGYMRVIGAQRLHVIGIPDGIEDRDEVWRLVSTLGPVREVGWSAAFGRNVMMAAFAAAFLGMLWTSSPQISLALAAFNAWILAWGLLRLRGNPNLGKASGRLFWMYLWLLFLIGLRVFTAIGQLRR